MMKKVFIIVPVFFLLTGFTCWHQEKQEDQPKPQVTAETIDASKVQVEKSEAFHAEIHDGNMWKVSLNQEHFQNAESVACIYNNIYYGVYLPTDTVFFPLLVAPDVELIISALDAEGKPLTTETFHLRRE